MNNINHVLILLLQFHIKNTHDMKNPKTCLDSYYMVSTARAGCTNKPKTLNNYISAKELQI